MPPRAPGREASVHPIDPLWRHELERATTETELVALARKYSQRHQFIVVASMPGVTPLPSVACVGDVSLVTYRLRRVFCTPQLDSTQAALVEKALGFFDALSERIFDLRSQEEPRQRLLPARMSANG
jgi:hypothetical protein